MELVKERLSTGSWVPPWVRHQHLARYHWASTYTKGCHVVEVACGTGYGTHLLARESAAQVDGFDVSPAAVEEARTMHPRDNVRFHVGDATSLPVADRTYDVFVSLETIEHLADDRAFLAEVARVLRSEGRFICSTPNRLMTNPGTTIRDRPFNPHHLREYSQPELHALLQPFFRKIEFFGQSQFGRAYQRRLTHLGRRLPAVAARAHQVRKLLGLPWERYERHWPRTITEGSVPEILVAVCAEPTRMG